MGKARAMAVAAVMALDRGLLESQREGERVVSVIYWESCLLVVQCHSYTRMILARTRLRL